jgi:hypothetical protein
MKMAEATARKLARILGKAGCPPEMVRRAREGYYDDFRSELTYPITQLFKDLIEAGQPELADRAKQGEFDGTREEAQAWAKSPEGRAIAKRLGLKDMPS